jgi:IgA Peptidase M64/Peptidase M64 N-terminus
MKTLLFFLLASIMIYSQISFDKYFENKTLRVDYFHTGDSLNDSYSIDDLKEEPYWGGSKTNLVDTFNYGHYEVKVFVQDENKLIYSRTYATLFDEWQTTDEAKHTTKTFSETVTMPFPKGKIRIEFYSRDKQNIFHKKFEYLVDPNNYFISPERHLEYPSFEVVHNGDPAVKVDIVILPEGYTENEMEEFKNDCNKFAGYLFAVSPYSENKDKFNIWGVEAPSPEEGTDIPANNVWKKTLMNTSFYTFDEERYLMTADYKSVRDLAANAPYDQIYILVNTDKYGGGSIYNYYSVCAAKNYYSEYVFTHEFGHGFAFLADEYYTSDVAYNDFYPLDVEPLEPNITTLVNFASKWKDMVSTGTPIPTPETSKYKDSVGVFEGGGYVAKGVYRPMEDCSMKTASVNNFCPVCRHAIQQMIDFYTK